VGYAQHSAARGPIDLPLQNAENKDAQTVFPVSMNPWVQFGELECSAGAAATLTNMPDAVRDTLLQASSLLYLFRSLAVAQAPEQKRTLELHIIRLINDVSGTDGGFVVLAQPGTQLMDAICEREFPLLDRIARRATAEGIFHDEGITAGPLYIRGTVEGVIGLMGQECIDVLGAVISLASTALESAREMEDLRDENVALRTGGVATPEFGILGDSPLIRNLRTMIERVAPRDASVLVLGESGTGKELIARALHAYSARVSRPFVAINCATLTESLLESELFGHERGAFTGAIDRKKGKLECADGGTVFLDEIGELAVSLQGRLLRVLQERSFERVGGTDTISVDIRLVAATNRDLSAEVKRGDFRSDLYHRLSVVTLRSPPLRDRGGDISLLARRFLELAAARCRRRIAGITQETELCLERYPWPGNVRELQNAIEHAAIMGRTEWIEPEDLPESVLDATVPAELPTAYHTALGETKRECVIRAWNDANRNHDEAARILGMHPNSLRRLIRNLRLRDTLARK
jgi:transcriptional regulator with GAF, ATPase, and Fis domain